MNFLITIIIPVYNVEDYLEKCLESVCCQTYLNLEIILIDDGSLDKSGDICDFYAQKDSRIKVIHKNNEGQGVARNVGLDIAKGDYIGFVDSDDWIEECMFEVLLGKLQETHSEVAICGYNELKKNKIYPCLMSSSQKVLGKDELMKMYLEGEINSSPWNKLYASSLFKDLRFPSCRAREDAILLPKLLGKSEKTVIIPDCLYNQLIRVDSTEHCAFNMNKLALIEAAESLQSYIKDKFMDLYPLVEQLRAEEMVCVMSEIIRSLKFKEYKELFMELDHSLKQEVILLQKKSITLDKRVRWAITYPFLFKIKYFFKGCEDYFKGLFRS